MSGRRSPPSLGDLVTSPQPRAVWRVLREPPPAAVLPLILQAERRAIRIAGIVRMIISVLLLVMVTVVRRPDLPTTFLALVWLALLCNVVAGAVPFALSRRGALLRRLATPMALFDCLVFGLLMHGTTVALKVPLGAFAALPPFVFGFVLLALSAMRFALAPVLAVGGFLVAMAIVPMVMGELPPVSLGPGAPAWPFFSHTTNLVRAAMIATVVAVLAMIVARSRVLLVEGLRIGADAANLARYLPAPVAERAARDGIEALSRGAEQPAAVLFADIVGFTALAERMQPQAVGLLLTELRGLQLRAVAAEGGIVDKFIGDGMMAVFGVPDPDPAAARHALATAARLRRDLSTWNEVRAGRGEATIGIGIGVDHGPVFAGAVGDAGRLEFTVLGDTVNLAQRCEALTRRADADLVVTAAALDAAGEGRQHWRRIEIDHVRGRAGEVELYAPA